MPETTPTKNNFDDVKDTNLDDFIKHFSQAENYEVKIYAGDEEYEVALGCDKDGVYEIIQDEDDESPYHRMKTLQDIFNYLGIKQDPYTRVSISIDAYWNIY